MKKPVKGEWWMTEKFGIVRFAFNEKEFGSHADLCVLAYSPNANGLICTIWLREEDLIRNLPGCTGFDWVEPAPAPAPETPHPSDRMQRVELWAPARIASEGGDWPLRVSVGEPPAGLRSWVKLQWSGTGFYVEKEGAT